VDPLILVDQAEAQGKIPRPIARKVRLRMTHLVGAVKRVEKASGLTYPPYYVEPVLPVQKSHIEYGQMGVLFARVIPTTVTGKLAVLVQFAAPLVAFGTRSTMEAVAAHEFTHYVDFVRRLSTKDVFAEEGLTTMYESSFADSDRLVPAKLLFNESSLVGLVTRKFKNDLVDPALNKKVSESWVAKGLPMRWVNPEDNRVKLGMDVVAAASFDPRVLAKIQEIQERTKP
jgi:hypothetical protein